MAGKARLYASAIEPVAEVAAGRALHLASHFLSIHMIAVRESFYPELFEPGGKCCQGAFGIDRLGVANDADPAVLGGKIFPVAIYAGRVAGKDGRRIVRRATVTESAVLSLSLMLGPVVIERRELLDDLRFNDVERRLASRLGLGRRVRVFCLGVEILPGAPAGRRERE